MAYLVAVDKPAIPGQSTSTHPPCPNHTHTQLPAGSNTETNIAVDSSKETSLPLKAF